MKTPATQLPAPMLESLRSGFPADFLTQEAAELETYGRDWTRVFPARPSAICFPRSTEEVVRLVKLCVEYRVPIVPSGGRTGLAGGAVAPNGEIVVSFTRMNKMHPVDTLAQTVRVQAGAVTEALHQHAEAQGLTWPIDFAAKGSSHIGGNISTNAGGVKVIHYGMTREWVLGLQVVTMNGDVLELNGELEKNNTGADLRQLFIGTEGTLGLVTEATLKLTRVPGALDVFFFATADMTAVLKLFQEARRAPFTLMAFETLTQNCMEAVTECLGIANPFGEAKAETYVLMEVERPASADAQAVLDAWLEGVFEKGLVQNGTIAQSPREAKELWKIREGVAESIYHRALPHKNDISVPVPELDEFVREMYALFARKHAGIEIYLFGHIGDGNLHINTLKPEAMTIEQFHTSCHAQDEDLFKLVQKHRGSISAEHGIGLLKKADLHFTRTPPEMAFLRQIKKAFDPHGLLNPGKIFD